MFFQSQYLQDVRGHSAVLSGLLILPITVPMVFISPLSSRLIARFGARRLMTAGMALRRRSGCSSSPRSAPRAPTSSCSPAICPFGVALGLVYAPMSTAAMAAMPAEKVGIASGVLAMDRVMAGTIALAATGALSHALLEGGDGFAAAIAGVDLAPGRALRAGRLADLGVRPRCRATQARPAAPPLPRLKPMQAAV